MDVSKLLPETQKYITEIMGRRGRDGIFDLEDCREILEYGRDIGSDAVYGIGCYFIAEYYWQDRIESETMRYLAEGTERFLKEGMGDFLARSYNLMGAVLDNQDNRVVALNYFYMGLQYAEKYELTYERGMIDFNIGFVLFRMKRYPEATLHYESSIEYYQQAEDNYYRSYNIALGMQHLGSCYLRQGRRQGAFSLLEEIDRLCAEDPERSYPEINIKAFRAECEAARGEKEIFLEDVRDFMETISARDGIGEEADNLESLAELLFGFEAYEQLDELFRILDKKGLSDRPTLYMSLYPYRSESLLRRNRREEYIDYTKKYFEAYGKDRRSHMLGMAGIMEMQEKLRVVEKEQAKMSDANRRLETIALYDSLTKLANRTRINEYMSQKFEETRKKGSVLGVEFLDIDHFKSFNDTYGHLEGDKCLAAVAGVLREVESKNVFCGRYGGDEFVVIYSGMTEQEIERVAERIQKGVRALQIPHEKSRCSDIVTVSQGVFVRIPDSESREWDYNSMADRALYESKRSGRNCYHIETDFFE